MNLGMDGRGKISISDAFQTALHTVKIRDFERFLVLFDYAFTDDCDKIVLCYEVERHEDYNTLPLSRYSAYQRQVRTFYMELIN
jgi:hypothetical protein